MSRCLALVLLCAGLLAGCKTVPIDHNNNRPERPGDEQKKAQQERVRENFEKMKKAIVDGDTKAYFAYLSQKQQADAGGYDGFLRAYAQNGNGWREMWRTAEMAQVAIDKEEASTLIRWGTIGPQVVVFLMENGEWHLHYVVHQ